MSTKKHDTYTFMTWFCLLELVSLKTFHKRNCATSNTFHDACIGSLFQNIPWMKRCNIQYIWNRTVVLVKRIQQQVCWIPSGVSDPSTAIQKNKYQERPKVRIWGTFMTWFGFLELVSLKTFHERNCAASNTFHDACIGSLYRNSQEQVPATSIKLQFRYATFPFYMRIVTTSVSTILLK